MTQGTHNYVADDRNASVVIDINGDHFPRPDAKISVFDSGFMLGDGGGKDRLLFFHQGRPIGAPWFEDGPAVLGLRFHAFCTHGETGAARRQAIEFTPAAFRAHFRQRLAFGDNIA